MALLTHGDPPPQPAAPLRRAGVSFDELLRRALISRATDFLRSGASAIETAYELGYSDPAHFSRAFRGWTGQGPREWRRAAS